MPGKIYWWCDHTWQFQGCCSGCGIQKIIELPLAALTMGQTVILYNSFRNLQFQFSLQASPWVVKTDRNWRRNSPCTGEKKAAVAQEKAKLSSQLRMTCTDLPAIHLLANLSCWQSQMIETSRWMKGKAKHFQKAFWLLEGMFHMQKAGGMINQFQSALVTIVLWLPPRTQNGLQQVWDKVSKTLGGFC